MRDWIVLNVSNAAVLVFIHLHMYHHIGTEVTVFTAIMYGRLFLVPDIALNVCPTIF
jgi:hypothetical protein